MTGPRGPRAAVTGALERTVATAGRTIAYSGLTVAVALAGLLVFDSAGLRSLALGGIGVVLVAVVAGLSLLPALLALLGHRIRPARVRTTPGVFWHIAGWVRRFAVPVVIVVGAGLVLLAVPFLHARFENPDARSLPRSSIARQLDEGRSRFPGGQADADRGRGHDDTRRSGPAGVGDDRRGHRRRRRSGRRRRPRVRRRRRRRGRARGSDAGRGRPAPRWRAARRGRPVRDPRHR